MKSNAFEVQYSYLPQADRTYRYNSTVLVVTSTIQRAIVVAEAQAEGIDVRVHQVIRRGAHQVIVDSGHLLAPLAQETEP